MHLRAPSTDRGVQSFIWAVVFFLFLYLGMVAIAVSKSTALILALVSGFVVFLLVRTRGDDDPRDRRRRTRLAPRVRPRPATAFGGAQAPEQLLDELRSERLLEADLRRRTAASRRPSARQSRRRWRSRARMSAGVDSTAESMFLEIGLRDPGRSLRGVNASSPIRAPAVSRRRSPSRVRPEGRPACAARLPRRRAR